MGIFMNNYNIPYDYLVSFERMSPYDTRTKHKLVAPEDEQEKEWNPVKRKLLTDDNNEILINESLNNFHEKLRPLIQNLNNDGEEIFFDHIKSDSLQPENAKQIDEEKMEISQELRRCITELICDQIHDENHTSKGTQDNNMKRTSENLFPEWFTESIQAGFKKQTDDKDGLGFKKQTDDKDGLLSKEEKKATGRGEIVIHLGNSLGNQVKPFSGTHANIIKNKGEKDVTLKKKKLQALHDRDLKNLKDLINAIIKKSDQQIQKGFKKTENNNNNKEKRIKNFC